MPRLEFSSKDLIIAWAAQVSLPQLGASVLAYVETKATITTLRLAAGKTSLKPFRNLPEEMILRIADKLRDTTFRENMKEWIQNVKCIKDECTLSSNATQVCPHEEVWDNFPTDLTVNNNSKFMKAARIFLHDFGILPYVIISKSFIDGVVVEMNAKAFLILPVAGVPTESKPGDGVATFVVNSVLDPAALKPLSDTGRNKFKKAARMLKLHAYNSAENESDYVDEPRRPRFAASSAEVRAMETRTKALKIASPWFILNSKKIFRPIQPFDRDIKPQLRIFGSRELETFIPEDE